MDLAHAVTVLVDGPRALGTRVVHRPVHTPVPLPDPAVPLPLVGCDRAGAKVFGGNRTIFGPRGPSVPMTTVQESLKMRRSLGELGVTQTVPRHPRNRLDGSCYRRRHSAGYPLRRRTVAADSPTPSRDRTDRTVDRQLPHRRTHSLGLPPVRDRTPRLAPRTRADHRRVDLQPPRTRRPPPHARPPSLRP